MRKAVTKQQYQEAIPDCCKLRTYEQHKEYLMFCWGLVSSIQQKKPLKCGICEFNMEKK
jgi:hypothetical protein